MRPSLIGGPALIGIAVFLAAVAAMAEESSGTQEASRSPLMDRWERLRIYEDRIFETQPTRRDSPLRELNINDEEVLEVRAAANEVFPGDMVHIAGVVTGCPCEDGPECTDQVWVVTDSRKPLFDGILLSRIKDHWQIGPVQRWWLGRKRLDAKYREFKTYDAYREARDAQTLSFPACPAELERIAKRWYPRKRSRYP